MVARSGHYGCTILMSYIGVNNAVSQYPLSFNMCICFIWSLTCVFHMLCTHTPEINDTSTFYWCIASKLKVPLFFLWNEQNVSVGGFNTFQSVLLWRYYNDKNPTGYWRYYNSRCRPPCSQWVAWRPHHERWAFTSNFVQYISGFWMKINDEIRPKYITLYDS